MTEFILVIALGSRALTTVPGFVSRENCETEADRVTKALGATAVCLAKNDGKQPGENLLLLDLIRRSKEGSE